MRCRTDRPASVCSRSRPSSARSISSMRGEPTSSERGSRHAVRLAGAELVVAGVHGDSVEPGSDAKGGIAAGQRAAGLDEDFLGDVLSVLAAAQQTQTEVVDAGRLSAIELGEGGFTAGAQPFEEPFVAGSLTGGRWTLHLCAFDRHDESTIGRAVRMLHLVATSWVDRRQDHFFAKRTSCWAIMSASCAPRRRPRRRGWVFTLFNETEARTIHTTAGDVPSATRFVLGVYFWGGRSGGDTMACGLCPARLVEDCSYRQPGCTPKRPPASRWRCPREPVALPRRRPARHSTVRSGGPVTSGPKSGIRPRAALRARRMLVGPCATGGACQFTSGPHHPLQLLELLHRVHRHGRRNGWVGYRVDVDQFVACALVQHLGRCLAADDQAVVGIGTEPNLRRRPAPEVHGAHAADVVADDQPAAGRLVICRPQSRPPRQCRRPRCQRCGCPAPWCRTP